MAGWDVGQDSLTVSLSIQMSALEDFRATLSGDPTDWLILADWLEEHGDERAEWVRRIAEKRSRFRAAHIYSSDSPSGFAELYLRRTPVKVVCRSITSYRGWFEAVMSLADAHLRWDAARERLLDTLNPATQEVLLNYERGYSSEQIAGQLGRSTDRVRRQFEETIRSLKKKLGTSR